MQLKETSFLAKIQYKLTTTKVVRNHPSKNMD